MLTASELAAQISAGEIAWPGDLRGDGLLLRLGAPLQPLADPGHVIDLASQDSIDALYADPAFAAVIAGLSHLARTGLAVHLASPWVMPGWDGHLTLELFNAGPAALRLRRDMPAGRAILIRTDGTAGDAVPHPHYGFPEHLGSRYAAEFGTQLAAHGTTG